jgi:hypothetical protein
MTIVLNEAAKADTELDSFDFTDTPIVKYIARHQEIQGREKGHILINLGIVYQILIANEDLYSINKFLKGKDLDEALTWSETPQGRDFWSDLHWKLIGE